MQKRSIIREVFEARNKIITYLSMNGFSDMREEDLAELAARNHRRFINMALAPRDILLKSAAWWRSTEIACGKSAHRSAG